VTDWSTAVSTERVRLGEPLCPEPGVDQGDPFLLEVPPSYRQSPYRYYVYVTAPGFPVYGSNTLTDPAGWSQVGLSYPGMSEQAWCWAPCVSYLEGLDRPWVMLYSRAAGAGEVEGHQGHQIRRADSTSPAGPFVDSGEVLTPDVDFAIDPEVQLGTDGGNRLFFATDFVDDQPYGTGIVEVAISPDLRRVESAPSLVARPGSDWQLYDPARSMPWKRIAGVQWDRGDTVRWSTVEGPAALRSPTGRQLLLYSGGNFAGFYGVGVLAREPDGSWVDLSPTPEQCLLSPDPDAGLYGPGHCSVLTRSGDDSYVCYHFRSRPDAPRQFGIVPLYWSGGDDLPMVRRA
jgi:GH43 family beta-xylosidase